MVFRVPEPCRAAHSGLPCHTQNGAGTTGNDFERPPAPEGLSSTIFNNSKNLASSSQELRPDTGGNTKRPESELIRKPLNTSIPLPHFQRGGCMLNHTGGTYSHSGVIDYPGFPISEWNLGKLLTLWNFKPGMSTSRPKFA